MQPSRLWVVTSALCLSSLSAGCSVVRGALGLGRTLDPDAVVRIALRPPAAPLCPGEVHPIAVDVFFQDGTQRTTEGVGRGDLSLETFVVEGVGVELHARQAVLVPQDGLRVRATPPSVRVALRDRPAVQHVLELPLRFNCSYRLEARGDGSGAAGHAVDVLVTPVDQAPDADALLEVTVLNKTSGLRHHYLVDPNGGSFRLDSRGRNGADGHNVRAGNLGTPGDGWAGGAGGAVQIFLSEQAWPYRDRFVVLNSGGAGGAPGRVVAGGSRNVVEDLANNAVAAAQNAAYRAKAGANGDGGAYRVRQADVPVWTTAEVELAQEPPVPPRIQRKLALYRSINRSEWAQWRSHPLTGLAACGVFCVAPLGPLLGLLGGLATAGVLYALSRGDDNGALMTFMFCAGPTAFFAVTSCLGAVGMVAPTLIGTLLGIPKRAPYWHYRFGTGWLEDQEDVLDEPAAPPGADAAPEDEGTPATPEEVAPNAEAPAAEAPPVGGTQP